MKFKDMKENNSLGHYSNQNALIRLLFYMKTTVLVLLICAFSSYANVSLSQTVEISKGRMLVKEALQQIEEEAGCRFVYSQNVVDVNREITVNTSKGNVEVILADIFKGTATDFKTEGDVIVLFENANKSKLSQSPDGDLVPVSGTVKDSNGELLPGVTVLIKGTTIGTVTDGDGKFNLLNVPNEAMLVFTFVGMQSQEVVVAKTRVVNVIMREDAIGLDEVVAVGYGTQKKVNLTGSVSVVKMEEVLGDRPVTSLGAILQGAMPGFTASTSAAPGGSNTFNVRGMESINGGAPLVLVDNVVFNDLYLINPDDIESVSVLKDASSAAIYGARASFGVILITTKKGKRNEKLTINYSNNFAFSKTNNLPELASPLDMIRTLQDGGYSSIWSGQNIETYLGLLQNYTANSQEYPLGWTEVNGTKYFLKQTDIMGDMFESSMKQTHNVSVRGGSEKINYRISVGYTDEDGILVTEKDAFTRTNVSSYVSGDITPWLTTSMDMKYNNGNKRYPFLDSSSELGIWKTNLPSYHPDGMLPYGSDGEEYLVMTPANIIKETNASKSVSDDTRIFSRTELKPVKGLSAILEYSFQLSMTDYEAHANYFQVHQGLAESIKPSTATGPFSTSRASTKYTTINLYANYANTFNELHNISLIVGYNQEYNDYRYIYSEAYNMISNGLPSLSGTDGLTPSETRDSYSQYAVRGGFFRANYNYDQKYFVEFNGRYDLSSKFPKDYRAGFFPSVSAAWNIGNEPFMKNAKGVVSQLKLRGSYGSLGNQNVSNYGYLSTLPVVDGNWIYNGVIPKTVGNMRMVRANYTWEHVNTIDGGIDFGFLDQRFTGTIDVYQRNTIGMLGPGEDLPAVAGAEAADQNAADMKTNGWEFSLNWKGNIGKVKCGLGFNIYDSNSHITKYKNESKLLSSSYYEGQEVGEIWGYIADGFYEEEDFEGTGALKGDVVSIQGVTSHVGDIKYKNLMDSETSVNVIDQGDNTAGYPGDRKVIGNSRSHFQYGLNGNAEWKGLGFSMLLQGVGKRDAWIGGNIIFPMSSQYGTVYKDQVDKIWTPDNKNAYYGRIYENAGSSQGANQRVSDKFLSNAAYLRVKNITLSYNLPANIVRRMYLKNVKVFFSGENLFTFDHLPSGIDPENLGWTYPHYRTLSFGINLNL